MGSANVRLRKANQKPTLTPVQEIKSRGTLCITRRALDGQDTIQIGHDTIIQIVEVKGGKVRLTVQAPVGVKVQRGERKVQWKDPRLKSIQEIKIEKN